MIQCFKCKQPIQPYERSIYASCGELAAIAHQRCVEQAQPELQLLLIDLGDSTVVKVEKGQWDDGKLLCRGERSDSVKVFYEPFTVVRDAIDAKPVPRIETLADRFTLIHAGGTKSFTKDEYYALCELAGHNLPIGHEGGKWERLNTHDWAQGKKDAAEQGYGINAFSFEEAIAPVKIWRYTR